LAQFIQLGAQCFALVNLFFGSLQSLFGAFLFLAQLINHQ